MKGMSFGEGTGSAFKKETKVEGSKHDKGGVGNVKKKDKFSKTRFGDKISSAARAITTGWIRGESIKEAYNKNKQADRTARRLGYTPSEIGGTDKYNRIRKGEKVETKHPKTLKEAKERANRNRVTR